MTATLVLRVRDEASSKLGGLGQTLRNLKGSLGSLPSSFLSMLGPLATVKGAILAVTGAIVAGTRQSMNYEKQMSAVRSVIGDVSSAEWTALSSKVQELGRTTSKSATEAGEGAENLARAGFSATEIVDALAGVLRSAEADAIPLATASNIVANNVRAFALEAKDATLVADLLAQTSASTNTNMIQLGEGLKYVAPVARQMGMSITDTSFALGLLANAGLQGSVGGTALKNMLLKLATPSSEGAKLLQEMGIAVSDASGNMRPLQDIVSELTIALPKLGGNVAQASAVQKVFGIRGGASASNLASAFEQMRRTVTTSTGESITQLEALRRKLDQSAGSAQRMSETRLDNLSGSFTLLGSAVEGLSITVFGPLEGFLKVVVLGFSNAVNAVNSFILSIVNRSTAFGNAIGMFVSMLGSFGSSFISTYLTYIEPTITSISNSFGELWGSLSPIFDSLSIAFGATGDSLGGLGSMIGSVLGVVAVASGTIVKTLLQITKVVVDNVVSPIFKGLAEIVRGFRYVLEGGDVMLTGLKKIGRGVLSFVFNTILSPIKLVLASIVKVGDAVGKPIKSAQRALDVLNMKDGTFFGRSQAEVEADNTRERSVTMEARRALSASESRVEQGAKPPTLGNLPETKVQGCIQNKVSIRGKDLNVANQEARYELSQRGGFGLNPYQRTAVRLGTSGV